MARKKSKENRIGAYIFIILLGFLALGAGIFAAIYQEGRTPGLSVQSSKPVSPVGSIKTAGVQKSIKKVKQGNVRKPNPSDSKAVEAESPPEPEQKPVDTPAPKKTEPINKIIAKRTEKPVSSDGATVAIIIDDFGNTIKNTDNFISLEAPVTFAVLPQLPHSSKISWKARQGGKEVILHLPLENKAGINPGPGTITTEMTDEEIEKLFTENINSVPGAVGFNNHEGSKATEDERVMKKIMEMASDKGFFFIDSYTSSASVGIRTAIDLGMASARRNVFLDNEDDVDYICGQLKLLAEKAKKEGKAVGIGHCRLNTCEAIKKMTPYFAEEGIRIVPASEIVR